MTNLELSVKTRDDWKFYARSTQIPYLSMVSPYEEGKTSVSNQTILNKRVFSRHLKETKGLHALICTA